MRRRARIDANQPLIVKALREAGRTVRILSPLGDGIPDLLVGYNGANFLLEVKDPAKKLSQRKLTDDEQDFFDSWVGQRAIVETEEEALRLTC
jgi:hypothetical protein